MVLAITATRVLVLPARMDGADVACAAPVRGWGREQITNVHCGGGMLAQTQSAIAGEQQTYAVESLGAVGLVKDIRIGIETRRLLGDPQAT